MRWKLAITIFFLMLICSLLIAPHAFGREPKHDGWPDSVERRACKDKSMWKLGYGCSESYVVMDCEGNVWSLATACDKNDCSILHETLLYKGKSVKKVIIKDTPKAKKDWYE